jgi:lipopolysaccharide biosynthesis regulator YciM
LQKAVTVYPRFAEALSQLGELYSEQGRKDEAARLLQQAIEADPRFVPPYLNLASLAGEQRDWPRMAELSQKALALNPYEYPLAFFYDAIANYNLRNFDAAEKSARTARRLDSQNHMSRIEFLLANILLQRDDYAGAAEHLRSFLKYSPSGAESDSARELLAQIESKLAARK